MEMISICITYAGGIFIYAGRIVGRRSLHIHEGRPEGVDEINFCGLSARDRRFRAGMAKTNNVKKWLIQRDEKRGLTGYLREESFPFR